MVPPSTENAAKIYPFLPFRSFVL